MNVDMNVFNTCFTSRVSVEIEQCMLSPSVNDSVHIGSVMMMLTL